LGNVDCGVDEADEGEKFERDELEKTRRGEISTQHKPDDHG